MQDWLTGVTIWLAVGQACAVADEGKAVWHKDYAAARAEARRSGRPMLVVFR